MKVAALAALSVLIALPADAGERHRQNNVSPICDNDGRCATLAVTAPTSSKASSFRGRHTDTAQRKPHRALDANGNSMLVTVQTAYGFNITVHPAYASKFLEVLRAFERAWLQSASQHHQVLGTARHACPGLQPLHRCGLRYSDGLESRARVRLPHERHRQTSWPVQRLHVPRLRSCRSGPWHAQPSAQPLRRHGKIQIGTIDSKLSTMSIFKSGLWFAPPRSKQRAHR
jgi:hypothetical protein